jgi:hypothetical protein
MRGDVNLRRFKSDISYLMPVDRSHPIPIQSAFGCASSLYGSRIENQPCGPDCAARHDAPDILIDTSPAFRPLRPRSPARHVGQPVGTGGDWDDEVQRAVSEPRLKLQVGLADAASPIGSFPMPQTPAEIRALEQNIKHAVTEGALAESSRQ